MTPTAAPDLSAWGFPAAETASRPPRGTNNEVLLVRADGRELVLRRYHNLDRDAVLREHRLLRALHQIDLPFAVPAPLGAADGGSVVTDADGVPTALFPAIPGVPGQYGVLAQIGAAGAALGRLDAALALLPRELALHDWAGAPLGRVHPAAPEVGDLVRRLRAELPGHRGVDWLARHTSAADRAAAELASRLPGQITHGDFALSNVLFDHDAVTGVLDFEISGWDLRVNDPVAGVMACTGAPDDPGFDAAVRAFFAGYAEHVTLEDAEWVAVPCLVRLRALGSAVWRAGRFLRGRSDLTEVAASLSSGLALEPHLHRFLP